MSILGNILSRITGGHPSSSRPPQAAGAKPPSSTTSAANAAPKPGTPSPTRVTTTPPPTAAASTLGANTPGPVPTPQPPMATGNPIPRAGETLDPVDVEKHLDALAAKSGQKLDWRHSIVDMMKLLGMESSLAERKELAKELGYTGDMGDSAKMNLWLHKEVLQQIARNGGKVPQELLH